jgi:hypothetical protein
MITNNKAIKSKARRNDMLLFIAGMSIGGAVGFLVAAFIIGAKDDNEKR